MIGIRMGDESIQLCYNPKFIMNGAREHIRIPFENNLWRLQGSYGVAYTYHPDCRWIHRLTLWFHWGHKCMPRDIGYITQAYARKKCYGFWF